MATPDRGADPRPPSNLIQCFKGYFATWVEVLKTRLDLVATEIEEERERIQHLLILAAVTSVCMALGVLLVTFFVVILFWETNYRLAVVGGLAVLYLAAGSTVGLIMRQKARQKGRLFSATLGELAKDYHHLTS